jgi:hypothetical protein
VATKIVLVATIGDKISIVASLVTKNFQLLIFGHQACGNQKISIVQHFMAIKMGLVLVTHKLALGNSKVLLT